MIAIGALSIFKGSNLDRLDSRMREICRRATTLGQIAARRRALTAQPRRGVPLCQRKDEGEPIDNLEAERYADATVMNAGASIMEECSLQGALKGSSAHSIRAVLSNVRWREPFRHTFILTSIAVALVAGVDGDGYLLAALIFVHRGDNRLSQDCGNVDKASSGTTA